MYDVSLEIVVVAPASSAPPTLLSLKNARDVLHCTAVHLENYEVRVRYDGRRSGGDLVFFLPVFFVKINICKQRRKPVSLLVRGRQI